MIHAHPHALHAAVHRDGPRPSAPMASISQFSTIHTPDVYYDGGSWFLSSRCRGESYGSGA
jgi:hypothetical protein